VKKFLWEKQVYAGGALSDCSEKIMSFRSVVSTRKKYSVVRYLLCEIILINTADAMPGVREWVESGIIKRE